MAVPPCIKARMALLARQLCRNGAREGRFAILALLSPDPKNHNANMAIQLTTYANMALRSGIAPYWRYPRNDSAKIVVRSFGSMDRSTTCTHTPRADCPVPVPGFNSAVRLQNAHVAATDADAVMANRDPGLNGHLRSRSNTGTVLDSSRTRAPPRHSATPPYFVQELTSDWFAAIHFCTPALVLEALLMSCSKVPSCCGVILKFRIWLCSNR